MGKLTPSFPANTYYANVVAGVFQRPPKQRARPLTQLAYSSQQLQFKALAPSTRRTYGVGVRWYLDFCRRQRHDPLPPSEQLLIWFLTARADTISWKTAQVYMSGLRTFFIEHGFSNPFKEFDLLRLTLQGLKREQGQQPRRPRKPITPSLLKQLSERLHHDQASDHDKAMLWAAFTTAFFGFLRVSEFTSQGQHDPRVHLTVNDVRIQQSYASIRIKTSKVDPYRKGHKVHLAANHGPLCPVTALARYAYRRLTASRVAPFFQFDSGRPLTRKSLAFHLHRLLKGVGMRAVSYNTHSFRIGAATAAARAGMPGWSIRRLGRWHSSAYHGYISAAHQKIDRRLASRFAGHRTVSQCGAPIKSSHGTCIRGRGSAPNRFGRGL